MQLSGPAPGGRLRGHDGSRGSDPITNHIKPLPYQSKSTEPFKNRREPLESVHPEMALFGRPSERRGLFELAKSMSEFRSLGEGCRKRPFRDVHYLTSTLSKFGPPVLVLACTRTVLLPARREVVIVAVFQVVHPPVTLNATLPMATPLTIMAAWRALELPLA